VSVVATRERIVQASAELFRRQGYVGTGMKQIVGEAGAPFGSIYHFFPGGKDELTAEVIRVSGAFYEELVLAFFDPNDIVGGVRAAFAAAAEVLRDTNYADACPIATVALEVASTNEPLRRATAEVFESWLRSGTNRLIAAGIGPSRARELTIAFVAALEGGFILSRATRDASHVEIAGAGVVALLAHEVAATKRRRAKRNPPKAKAK
jgi:AcrR family transcriptional regulator